MRINISIPEEDFLDIKEFAELKYMKVSSIFLKGAKQLIENESRN